jgi:hypothetical protein
LATQPLAIDELDAGSFEGAADGSQIFRHRIPATFLEIPDRAQRNLSPRGKFLLGPIQPTARGATLFRRHSPFMAITFFCV